MLTLATGSRLHAETRPHLQLDPNLESQSLGDQLDLHYSSRPLSAAEALALPASAWQRSDRVAIRQGIGDGEIWVRSTLRNDSDQPLRRLLVTDHPDIALASLYRIDADGGMAALFEDAGITKPFAQRPQLHRRLLSTLEIPAGSEVTLLWRLHSSPLLHFDASLWEENAFWTEDSHRNLVFGMLYGALLIMAIYNLFLWMTIQERHYLYYVLFLLACGYLVGASEGHVYQYLLPESNWPKQIIYYAVGVGAVLSFLHFSSAFLRLRRHQPQLLRWMRWIAYANVALLVAGGLLQMAPLLQAAIVAAVPFFLLALAAGVRMRLRGELSAGHYAVAILVMATGVTLHNLSLTGLLPLHGDSGATIAISTALMMAFFSLALADKINQLQRDSSAASSGISRANREIQRINDELLEVREERARLEQMAISARQESAAKSAFLATIGHEIRTPMSGVLGMAELLKGTELDSTQLHYVSVIERSGHNLMEMISNLLDYAIIEGGGMELDIAPFALEALLDDCIALFTLRAVEKNLDLFAELTPDIPPLLKGDATKLRQVILNLLSNALKFTEQGDIVLRVSPTGHTTINSLELRFEVIDTGIGLSPEAIERLFKPFAGEQPGVRHSGLGLAISRQLVELMDGEIGVESREGEGSRFWFTARFMALPEAVPISPTPLAGHQLLLIANPGPATDALQRMLQHWGGEVTVACSLAQSQALLGERERRIDLVLVENPVDNGSGTALVEALNREFGARPTVLLTGANRPPTAAELERSGIRIVLEKPITHGPLRGAIQQAFGVAPEQRSDQPLNFSNRYALVVEDNPVNQMVLVGQLRQLGVDARAVDNGFAAIELCRELYFDIVLMDCEMPQLDGYETARQLRAQEQREKLKRSRIVAVSAHASSDHQQKSREAGMDDCLTKPVTQQMLAEQLKRLT
jgi:signal transduction histidine kinase/CheY-like chemotaxis protein